LTGGDKLKEFRVNGNYKLINNYGPTENTVVTTSYEVNELSTNIPIGKPLTNTQVYIFDKDNNVVPIGVQGEICISGDSLAKGYLNRESLTKDKFVTNPIIAGQRMYRTGDLGKWSLDGTLLFLSESINRLRLGDIELN
jgi:non-ribosomal peptide synthetase component F